MKCSLSLALVPLLASIAFAEVKVLTSDSCSGAPPTAGQVTVTIAGGKYHIEFSAIATGSYFVCSDPGDVVEWIRCDAAALGVRVSTVTNRPISVVEEITTTGATFGGFRIADVRIGERLGPTTLTTQALVRANSIFRLEGLNATLNCAIEMMSASSPGGNIRFPQATLRTDIRNAFDGFDTLEFKSIEGTSADPVDIVTAGTLRRLVIGTADNNGDTITAGDAVNVNIGDPTIPPAQRTMRIGDIICARDFSGRIAVRAMVGGSGLKSIISTGRDLTGFVEVEEGLGGSLTLRDDCDPAIRVGRSLTAGSLVQLPLPGGTGFASLGRPVIINASRTQLINPGGQWLGDIGFGRLPNGSPVRLLAKDRRGQYLDPSAEFGFGAVGLVPFGTYGSDSFIAFVEGGATSVSQRGVFKEVSLDQPFTRPYKGVPEHLYARVRFFGPIVAQISENSGIIEYRSRNMANTGCWTRLCLATVGGTKKCREFIVGGGTVPPGVTPPPLPGVCTPECTLAVNTVCNGALNMSGNCQTDEAEDIEGGDRWSILNHVFLNNFEYRIRVPNGNGQTEGRCSATTSSIRPPLRTTWCPWRRLTPSTSSSGASALPTSTVTGRSTSWT